MKEKDILILIEQDIWMMRILEITRDLNLPDWWIGAGFVRNKVWDHLHGYEERTPLADVDVIYFDPSNLDEAVEDAIQDKLKKIDSTITWSVTNQARMHIPSNEPPYKSSEHALSLWPETPTSVAVTLNDKGGVALIAPHGIQDLVTLTVNPTPHWRKKPGDYESRLAKKKWDEKWPKLIINHLS
ncbi:MAG TPA: nucleotidyltransferase family protein [Patescibacteria group bacterium]